MRTRILRPAALLAILISAAAACRAPSGARVARSVAPVPAACDSNLALLAANTAANLAADRRHENRFLLPWTDTLPPAPVRDPAVCARAAAAYAPGSNRGAAPAPAGVVRAGGLYFVISWPLRRAGEFTIVGVLDGQFRWLVGVAG